MNTGTPFPFGSLFFLELELWNHRQAEHATLYHSYFLVPGSRFCHRNGSDGHWQGESQCLHFSCSPTLCSPLVTSGIIISELEVTNSELVRLLLLRGHIHCNEQKKVTFTIRIRRKNWTVSSRKPATRSLEKTIVCLKIALILWHHPEWTSPPCLSSFPGRMMIQVTELKTSKWRWGKWISVQRKQGEGTMSHWDD